MKISLSKKGDERGRHLCLIFNDVQEARPVHHVIQWDILDGSRRPIRETDSDGRIIYRFNLKYLDRLALTFPMAELSNGIYKMLYKAEEERLARMPVPDLEIPGFNGKLFDFQKIAVQLIIDWIYAEKVGYPEVVDLLNDELGLGKSFVALAVIAKLEAYPALIVCPNNAKYNWADYIEQYFDTEFVVVDGTAYERAAQINKRAQITIANWEAIRAKPIHEHGRYGRIVGYTYSNPGFFEEPYAFCVADEYHRAKTPGRQVTNGLFQLQAADWLPMSGTPILNRVEESWPILHKLWPDLYPHFETFVRSIGIADPTNPTRVVAYKPDKLAELRTFVQQKSLRRRKDQVQKDLPEQIEVLRFVELTAEQRKLYNQVRDELKLELKDGTVKHIGGTLPYITRLKQACASPELYGGSPVSSKIDELKVIVEQLVSNGEKAIIYSQWSKMTRIIQRELSKYDPAYVTGEFKDLKYRHAEAKRFLHDEGCKLYIGTIGANRESINLGAATWVIFTDQGWVPATDEDQPVGRSAAGGLRGAHLPKGTKVHVVKIKARDTIEERIDLLLQKKRNITNRFNERDAGKKIQKITVEDILSLI